MWLSRFIILKRVNKLGENTRIITNNAGDKISLSADGLRRADLILTDLILIYIRTLI